MTTASKTEGVDGMAELEQVLERRDAAAKEWRTLSSRSKGAEEAALQRLNELNKLADDVAEAQARTSEEEQRQRVGAMEQELAAAEASVTELRGRLADGRNKLTLLERERPSAKPIPGWKRSTTVDRSS